MRKTNAWRQELDLVARLAEDLKWEPDEVGGEWLAGKCPVCEGPGRWQCNCKTHQWQCHNDQCDWNSQEGLIEDIVSWLTGETPSTVVERWKRSINPDALRGKAKLPTEADIVRWCANRHGNKGVQRWMDDHAISEAVAEECNLGLEYQRLKLPVYNDAVGSEGRRIMNLKSIAYQHRDRGIKKKNVGLNGRSPQPWPWQHIAKWDAGPIVITEGEPDAMCLMSVGCNVITTTNGAGSLSLNIMPKHLFPSYGKREVILCMDNDSAGEKAGRKLIAELRDRNPKGVIRLIRLPDSTKDISEYLARIEPRGRVREWSALVDNSPVLQGGHQARGITEELDEICRVGKDGDITVLAQFTGVVLEGGTRYIGDEEAGYCLTLLLTHKDKEHGSIEVIHKEGGNLADELLSVGGAAWSILPKDASEVFDFICSKTSANGGTYPKMRYGWAFGFVGKDREEFVTKNVIYSKSGPQENRSYKMDPDDTLLKEMTLPHPTPDKVRQGMKLFWEHAYQSHVPSVMMPLLLIGIMAPVRRLLCEHQDNFFAFVRGASEAGKTTRAKVAQCLYGDFWGHHLFPSFQDTLMALERRIASAGDAMVLVDDLDYTKIGDKEIQQVRTWLQGTPQGGGRHRAARDGGVIHGQASHGIKVITCEHIVKTDIALLGRSIIIEVGSERIALPTMDDHHDEVFRKREFLPYVLSAWIAAVTRNPERFQDRFEDCWGESATNIEELLADRVKAVGTWYRVPQSSRVRNRLRLFDSFFHLFTEWCRESGYLPESQLTGIQDDWEQTVPILLNNLLGVLLDGGVSTTALRTIEGVLLSGEACMVDLATGIQYPARRSPNAKEIGVLIPTGQGNRPKTLIKNQVDWQQAPYAVTLHEGCGRIWGADKTEWTKNRQYLVDNKMLAKEGVRKPIACQPLTPESAQQILSVLGERRLS